MFLCFCFLFQSCHVFYCLHGPASLQRCYLDTHLLDLYLQSQVTIHCCGQKLNRKNKQYQIYNLTMALPHIYCFRDRFPEHIPPLPVRWRFPVVWVWGGVCWKLDGPSECKRRILLHSAAGTERSPHYLQHRAHYSLHYSTAYLVHCTSTGQVSLSTCHLYFCKYMALYFSILCFCQIEIQKYFDQKIIFSMCCRQP